MALRVDLFCEDAAHEAFGRAIVERVAADEGVQVSIRVGSARAGVGRLQRELRAYTETTRRQGGVPDVLVVLIDANTEGPQARRDLIGRVSLDDVFPRHVIGTPDPCVEAWLLADPPSLTARFGQVPSASAPADCDELKERLKTLLLDAGETLTQGGSEFADEIVEAMDLYRAGRADPTLKRLMDDLRSSFRQADR